MTRVNPKNGESLVADMFGAEPASAVEPPRPHQPMSAQQQQDQILENAALRRKSGRPYPTDDDE
jgi:hypothetical protein